MKNKIVYGLVIIGLISLFYFSGVFNLVYDELIDTGKCKIVKEYPNACDDYTKCNYIEYKGQTIACINGEEIIISSIESKQSITIPMRGGGLIEN